MPKGYLLVQILATSHESRYGAISTRQEADNLFAQIRGKIDGLEYQTLSFHDGDMQSHRLIAEEARRSGIDLWASTWKLLKSMWSLGEIPAEYHAYVMRPDGSIVAAVVDERPLFDCLNPEAVKWFIVRYRRAYLEPMKGLLSGLFCNEDTIPYLGVRRNELRIDYWNNASYSPTVYEAWKQYCLKNNIRYNGSVVDKFPVHRPEMTVKGGGKTAFFPGYDVPEKIIPGQRLMDLPKAKGIWKSWFAFLSEQFAESWIDALARAANDVNRDNPHWYGVMYFGLHQWTVSYENIENPEFTVSRSRNLGAWGLQRGIDLSKLSRDPEINMIACETLPPIEGANLELYIKEFEKKLYGSGKKFGVMLHRDDRWRLDQAEEERRWKLINKYKVDFILRYPLSHMLAGDEYFDEIMESKFFQQLEKYRTMQRAAQTR